MKAPREANLGAAGEQVLTRSRLHPVVFSGAVWLAGAVCGVTVLVVTRNDLAPATVRELWSIALAISAFGFAVPFARWRWSEFAVTSERVVLRTGLLRVRAVDLPLPQIEALEVERSLGGRLLGYGTVQIVGRDGTAASFTHVAQPEALRTAVRARLRAVRGRSRR